MSPPRGGHESEHDEPTQQQRLGTQDDRVPRRRSRRLSQTLKDDKESSSEDKGSAGSWNVDRGRSRTRRMSNPASEDNLRRRGYHALSSSFGKVFHVEKRWKMIRDMGSGAYGVVISAADEISGETVAIKLVTRVFEKTSLAKRALREITLLRHFANHENITGLIDVDAISKDFNEIYLFLEPMEADLHQIIKSGQALTNEHVQYFVYQILRGMKYVHSASVVHRDLKPGNLLVNADCELKICDFGLSRGFNAAPDEFATHMTEYVATRWYRAPEIMLAFKRYHTAIDVWSIGCILAELILGRPLFKGKDYVDQLNKILDILGLYRETFSAATAHYIAGTPDENVLKRIGSDKARDYVRSLPYRKRVPFSKVMPSADPQAIDLLEKMLDFDPEKRVTVVQALEHPWLSAYHDVNDEPECPEPYNKWHAIEKLETIEEYREALWNEIQEYRKEVRSIGIDMAYLDKSSISPTARRFSAELIPNRNDQVATPPPDIKHEDEEAQDAESATAVDVVTATGEDTVPKIPSSATDEETAKPPSGAELTAMPSPVASVRPSIERRDSLRPATPANMANDPVVHYARRSSILQAQQMGHGSSISPVRRMISGLPATEEVREGFPVPSQAYAPSLAGSKSTSNSTSYFPPPGPGNTIGSNVIPFPSAHPASYILPARSRTASMAGGEPGTLSHFGARKLLRTLSTVSIHESVEEHGGLAAMGPMGQAIIERRETAADAPASVMPREFNSHTLKEEDESVAPASSANELDARTARSACVGDNPQGPASGKDSPGKSSTPNSAAERDRTPTNGSGSGSGTPSTRKKEKRFIIF